jgi:hypothetical protein
MLRNEIPFAPEPEDDREREREKKRKVRTVVKAHSLAGLQTRMPAHTRRTGRPAPGSPPGVSPNVRNDLPGVREAHVFPSGTRRRKLTASAGKLRASVTPGAA